LLSTTPEGVIVAVNQTLLDWTGYQREQLVGARSFSDLLSVGGRIYYETHYAPLLVMQGSAREIAFDLVAADGRRLPALVNATFDRADRETARVHVAVFDATERRSYERELLAAKQRAEISEAHAHLLSRTLQQTLIPHEMPNVPGLEIAAVYRPALGGDEIGGDFYDVFQLGVDDWMLAIGDVQGKGVQAAVLTALARSTVRAAAVERERPSDVLRLLNDVLLHYESDRLCTAVLLRCRRFDDRWLATVACAGHPLPLSVGRDGAIGEVGRPGTILGLHDRVRFHDVDVELSDATTLVLFTDGVSEARRNGVYYGERRIAEVAAGAGTAATMVTAVLDDVLEFQNGWPHDDIAVVAVRAKT
jgi:sigma-B regulation protein RsbU (phosphoserine phosphatase)